MEITKASPVEKIKSYFVKDKIPFAYKADVNWKTVQKCAAFALSLTLVIVLFLPSSKVESNFHEKLKSDDSTQIRETIQDPTEQAINQISQSTLKNAAYGTQSSSGGISPSANRNAPMILSRDGGSSKAQLPAGSRIAVHLTERAVVASTGLPVIGVVTRDCNQDDVVAIPKGSKVFGQVSFGEDGDRAQIDWRAVELLDGTQKQLSGIGVSLDGQVGIDGTIHSNVVQNSAGATLTRFVGAYAQGSMQNGILGAAPGGNSNGFKNAIAQTANDQANALAEDLKKEKRWIEISPKTEFNIVLTNDFIFRAPGSTYAR